MRHSAAATTRVYGPSWRRQGARRQHAARIARTLRPVVLLLGGTVSTELAVPLAGRWHRPDVGVVVGDDLPHDGRLERAPMLVVRLGGPPTAGDWLAAGADAVWSYRDGAVEQLTARGVTQMARGQWLAHPFAPALRLPASDLLPAGRHGTRTDA